jgi:hypothetical protein
MRFCLKKSKIPPIKRVFNPRPAELSKLTVYFLYDLHPIAKHLIHGHFYTGKFDAIYAPILWLSAGNLIARIAR